jgi:hypothetical protein
MKDETHSKAPFKLLQPATERKQVFPDTKATEYLHRTTHGATLEQKQLLMDFLEQSSDDGYSPQTVHGQNLPTFRTDSGHPSRVVAELQAPQNGPR